MGTDCSPQNLVLITYFITVVNVCNNFHYRPTDNISTNAESELSNYKLLKDINNQVLPLVN